MTEADIAREATIRLAMETLAPAMAQALRSAMCLAEARAKAAVALPSAELIAEGMWQDMCPGIRQTAADKATYTMFAESALKLIKRALAMEASHGG